MFTLQHLALPITEFNCPLDMYVRCDSRNLGNFLISKECFTIGEGEVATFGGKLATYVTFSLR